MEGAYAVAAVVTIVKMREIMAEKRRPHQSEIWACIMPPTIRPARYVDCANDAYNWKEQSHVENLLQGEVSK